MAILAIFVSLTACTEEPERPSPPDRESVEIRPMVVFDLTDDQPLYIHVETQGVVEPAREIKITPRISGFIRMHKIREGARVSAGDTLLAFVDDEWRLDLADASEEFERDYNQFLIEKRMRFGTNPPPDDSVEMRSLRNQYRINQAQIRKDRSALMLSYASIIAPFDGYISTKENMTTGQYLGAGGELGKLVDQSTVIVRFDLLESELEIIKEGMPVELFTARGNRVAGVVENTSPVVNPDTKTGQVVASFDNSDGLLRSGMTVDGRILIEKVEGRVRAPRSAMLRRDNRPLVFKLIDGTVHWIYIEPLAYTSEWVVFTHNDVAPGDTLAVDRHFAISHLQKIEPRLR